MSITSRIFKKILRILRIDFILLFLGSRSYLITKGWFKSSFKKSCLDSNNDPIPWWTYSAIKFLDRRLNNDLSVFEFGAGFSTIWLANRVKSVTSVENDLSWIHLIKKQIPSNVEIIYSETNSTKNKYGTITFLELGNTHFNYSKEILRDSKKYDIIIIDGIDRNNCIKTALERLSDNGVIIVDNLELEHLMSEGLKLLYKNDFKLIDFWGLSAGIAHETGTGIFYKNSNCIGI
jgi:precorrin-6B methylase 2